MFEIVQRVGDDRLRGRDRLVLELGILKKREQLHYLFVRQLAVGEDAGHRREIRILEDAD